MSARSGLVGTKILLAPFHAISGIFPWAETHAKTYEILPIFLGWPMGLRDLQRTQGSNTSQVALAATSSKIKSATHCGRYLSTYTDRVVILSLGVLTSR